MATSAAGAAAGRAMDTDLGRRVTSTALLGAVMVDRARRRRVMEGLRDKDMVDMAGAEVDMVRDGVDMAKDGVDMVKARADMAAAADMEGRLATAVVAVDMVRLLEVTANLAVVTAVKATLPNMLPRPLPRKAGITVKANTAVLLRKVVTTITTINNAGKLCIMRGACTIFWPRYEHNLRVDTPTLIL